MKEPWLQRPDEPARWFDRFEWYRTLGPTRSLLAAYRAAEGKERSSAPDAWRAAAQRWEWKVRAKAWDETQQIARQRTIDDARESDTSVHRAFITRYQKMLADAMLALPPERATWSDITAALRFLSKEIRTGLTPADKDEQLKNAVAEVLSMLDFGDEPPAPIAPFTPIDLSSTEHDFS